MNCGKQGYYARDCRGGQQNHAAKTKQGELGLVIKKLRGTKECSINSFVFCYNNACRIYEDAKYSVSYWPQELELRGLKGT